MAAVGELVELRELLRSAMVDNCILGTIIIANEGLNATVCGTDADISSFVKHAEAILHTNIEYKASYHDAVPFNRVDVKIKPEIVTLKHPVDTSIGLGTHVKPEDWNSLISDPDVFVLDARNDYEFKCGTFEGAINPTTEKFSDLPAFIRENLDPEKQKKVAMFCTGGIRCEKLTPFMKSLGFENVFQLEGGILKYLETIAPVKQLWRGECYVFDKRVSVDETLSKGHSPDLSLMADE